MSSISECVPIRSWSEGPPASWEITKTTAEHIRNTSHDLLAVQPETRFSFQICETPEIPTACASSHEEIIDSLLLHSPDSNRVVDRLRYLYRLCANDSDEHDVDIDSLRAFVKFFAEYDLPSNERISVGPEGLLLAEWMDTTKRCAIAVEFLSTDGIVRFSAFFGTTTHSSGTKPAHDAIEELEHYLSEF